MADTNDKRALERLLDEIVDCAVSVGMSEAMKGFGAFTEIDSISMTAMRRSISQKRAQILGHFDATATPPADAAPAQPAVKVGDSFFESWYSLYNPEGKSTKQTMREAYEAGLVDHEGRIDGQPAVPDDVAKDAARYRWMRADSPNAYMVIRESAHLIDEKFDAAIDAAILSATEGRKDE